MQSNSSVIGNSRQVCPRTSVELEHLTNARTSVEHLTDDFLGHQDDFQINQASALTFEFTIENIELAQFLEQLAQTSEAEPELTFCVCSITVC